MNNTFYPTPVDRLLALGECDNYGAWLNYLELGLGAEHVADLIRMMADVALLEADSDSPEVWAPLHALRALGQLRAEAAILPIIGLFQRTEPSCDDHLVIGFHEAMGMIGPVAIPALRAYLADTANATYPRSYAGDCLADIARRHPSVRAECVQSICAALADCEKNEPDLNGFLIANLLDLKAVEAATVMEAAFAKDCVEEFIAGDWEDVQIELGLLHERKSEPRFSILGRFDDADEERATNKTQTSKPASWVKERNLAEKKKLKNKRTTAAKSRRVNRKKKK